MKQYFLSTACILPLTLVGANAHALPVHDKTVAGHLDIQAQSETLTIDQNTNNAIAQWQQFDIGETETVTINQPGPNSILLNRVIGEDPSEILGNLNANGNVWIMNPSGVMFGDGSQVDVGGLLATTADIDNENFMAGHYHFNKPGKADSVIVNKGTINADHGIVGLLAPNVSNEGTIQANFGKVALAATETFTVDFHGDGLINIALDNLENDNTQSNGYRVKNSGNIIADAGRIEMHVAQGNALVERTLDHSWGTIQANSVGTNKNGQIVLGGGTTATTRVKSAITAKGSAPSEHGGEVTITGNQIELTKNASIDASGQSGGGTVRIGGDIAGKGEIANATNTTVAAPVHIDVSAVENGDSGTAVVWADNHTEFHGTIDAKGGAKSGDGGFVEVSGKDTLTFSGFVDRNAPNGEAGMLLLDPTDITISTAADSANNVNTATLVTNLGGGPVTVDTFAAGPDDGDLTVSDAISWATANSLTLQASNNLTVNANITNTSTGGLTLDAGNDGAGDLNVNNAINVGGDININATGGTATISNTLTTNGGNVTFSDSLIASIGGDITTNGGNLDLQNTVTTGRYVGNRIFNAGSGTLNVGTGGLSQLGGGNNIDLIADNMTFSGAITTGSNRILTIRPSTAGTTLGIGNGATGTLSITDAMLGHIASPNGILQFRTEDGVTPGTGADVDIHNLTVDRNIVRVYSGIGQITVDAGGITAHANNSITRLQSDNFNILGNVAGTGELRLYNATRFGTLGIGNGTAGANNLSDAEMANIVDGWSLIDIYSADAAVEVGAMTWNDNVSLGNGLGTLTISGAQNVGANTMDLGGRRSIVVNAPLSGTGTLIFTVSGSTGENVFIGSDAGVGGMNVSDASLAQIQDGWSEIIFSDQGAGSLTYDPTAAITFTDPVRFRASDNININDTLLVGAGSDASFTFGGRAGFTADNVNFTSAIDTSTAAAGEGAITFEHTDQVNLSHNITTAGGNIDFQNTVTTTTLGATVTLDGGAGSILFNGSNFNNSFHTLTAQAEDFAIGGNISGTANLTITTNNNVSMGLGDGQPGTAHLGDAELDFIQDGFANVRFGNSNGLITVGARTWLDDVHFNSFGTGVHVTGIQNSGANNLNIFGTPIIDAALTGTGSLAFNNVNAIGDDAVGTRQLDDTELGRLTDGWGEILFADNSSLTVDTNGYQFIDPIVFRGGDFANPTSVIINDDVIAAAGSNASFTFRGNANAASRNLDTLTINANVDTSGAATNGEITFSTFIDTANLNGNLTTNGANITLTDDITNFNLSGASAFNAGAGTIAVGASGINTAANDLQFIADEITLNGDLDGTGNLTLRPSTNATTISLNDGNTTGLDFSAAELARIGATTDFASITIGGAAHTGVMNVGAWTPDSALTLQAGSVNLDGNVNVGARTLNVTANTGNIGYTSGTLTADTLNLDAVGTTTADVNVATTLDIANNSTATTLTGLFQAGATQTEADLITGGPGNDANYTFEGFTIRLAGGGGGGGGGGGTPPSPPVIPDPDPDPTPDPGPIAIPTPDPIPDPTPDPDPVVEPDPTPDPDSIVDQVEPVIDEAETIDTATIIIDEAPINELSIDEVDILDSVADGIFTIPTETTNTYIFDNLEEGTAVVVDGAGHNTVTTDYIPQIGDSILSGLDFGFDFMFDENSIIKMTRNSEVRVQKLLFSPDGKEGKYVDIKKGAVGFFSDHETHKGEVKAILPGIAIKVTGTCYIVDFDDVQQRTYITLFGGGIELYIKGQLIKLKHPIQMISFDGKMPGGSSPIQPVKLNMNDVRNNFKDRPEVIPSREQLLKCGVPETEII